MCHLRRLRHGICVAKMLDNVGLWVPHAASCFGAKAPRTLRPLPVSVRCFRHWRRSLFAASIICAFGLASAHSRLAVSALRIMRYCLKAITLLLAGLISFALHAEWPMRSLSGTSHNGHSFLPRRISWRASVIIPKATPHNSRLAACTAQQLRHGICVAKMSIMSGCSTRIVLQGKALALCDRCPLLPVRCFRHWRRSPCIQYYLRFGLASAAPRSPYRYLELCGIA